MFRDDAVTTAGRWVALARERLGATVPGALFAGGTDIYFCHLNQERPQLGPLDGIVYPITPQVHAFDEISIVENAQAQADTVRTARTFAGGRAIVISPVTLRPRAGRLRHPLARMRR